ncbi:hypothetical protein YC2023_042169 [Brassica napus]
MLYCQRRFAQQFIPCKRTYESSSTITRESGKETGLRRQHVLGSIHLLHEIKSQLSWSPNTDMGLCFRAHLNTRRESLSVGCTSPWGLVRASPWAWDTPG